MLQNQLDGLQLDRVLGTQLSISPDHPYQSLLLRDFKAQIEAVRLSDEKESGSDNNQPIYEVYTRTEAAKFAHLSKVVCLCWEGGGGYHGLHILTLLLILCSPHYSGSR